MLIVIDSDSNENIDNVLMADDDSGVGIIKYVGIYIYMIIKASDLKIPTLLISYENGDKLK